MAPSSPLVKWFPVCVNICVANFHVTASKVTKGFVESEQGLVQPPEALWFFCNPGMCCQRYMLSVKVEGGAFSLSVLLPSSSFHILLFPDLSTMDTLLLYLGQSPRVGRGSHVLSHWAPVW